MSSSPTRGAGQPWGDVTAPRVHLGASMSGHTPPHRPPISLQAGPWCPALCGTSRVFVTSTLASLPSLPGWAPTETRGHFRHLQDQALMCWVRVSEGLNMQAGVGGAFPAQQAALLAFPLPSPHPIVPGSGKGIFPP